jgi:hypothetical protein
MSTKICTHCNVSKDVSEFHNRSLSKDGKRHECKQCSREQSDKYRETNPEKYKQQYKNYHEAHKEKEIKNAKKWQEENKDRWNEYQKNYLTNFPWERTLTNIKYRCNNPDAQNYHRYGGRGIKCQITSEELKELWFRDKAYLMETPSIDRINNDGDYTFENCQYLELIDNSNKQHLDRKIKVC